jgi:hypothetical protein
MEINWPHILTGIIAFILGLIIKTLLDFNVAMYIVKWFYWIPTRSVFRDKPHKIAGDWEQTWDFSATNNYSNITDRHSYTKIKQLGRYCYCEFYSVDGKYYVFGTISDSYFIGRWGDTKDKLGYYGTFQLRIINSNSMFGKWIGHSKSTQNIFGDNWTWTKRS